MFWIRGGIRFRELPMNSSLSEFLDRPNTPQAGKKLGKHRVRQLHLSKESAHAVGASVRGSFRAEQVGQGGRQLGKLEPIPVLEQRARHHVLPRQ